MSGAYAQPGEYDLSDSWLTSIVASIEDRKNEYVVSDLGLVFYANIGEDLPENDFDTNDFVIAGCEMRPAPEPPRAPIIEEEEKPDKSLNIDMEANLLVDEGVDDEKKYEEEKKDDKEKKEEDKAPPRDVEIVIDVIEVHDDDNEPNVAHCNNSNNNNNPQKVFLKLKKMHGPAAPICKHETDISKRLPWDNAYLDVDTNNIIMAPRQRTQRAIPEMINSLQKVSFAAPRRRK